MSTDPGKANPSASISPAAIGCRVDSVMPVGPMGSSSGSLAATWGKNSQISRGKQKPEMGKTQSEKVVALAQRGFNLALM